MRKIIDFFLLKKEAHLFDAKLYILKALVAVIAAYVVAHHLPLAQKDMISVLFGLMMTLEPVTVTGIRSGLRQISATFLGALATAIIIALFGINIWTIALSVAATLFLCLKINWREVSPVAIFTSIYMTQYVQFTAAGEPSIFLTFQLRILALGVGVFVAIVLNFLFSLFFYKRMEKKRIAHLLMTIGNHLKNIKNGILESSIDHIYHEKELMPSTFNGIDWLFSLIKDKEKEALLKKKLQLKNQYEETIAFQEVLIGLRNITHLIYDTTYVLAYNTSELSTEEQKVIVIKMDILIKKCDYLAVHFEQGSFQQGAQYHSKIEVLLNEKRIMHNLDEIEELLNRMPISK